MHSRTMELLERPGRLNAPHLAQVINARHRIDDAHGTRLREPVRYATAPVVDQPVLPFLRARIAHRLDSPAAHRFYRAATWLLLGAMAGGLIVRAQG